MRLSVAQKSLLKAACEKPVEVRGGKLRTAETLAREGLIKIQIGGSGRAWVAPWWHEAVATERGRRALDPFGETHEVTSALVAPETIEPGDLIFYYYEWHPVTHTKVEPEVVLVHFSLRGEIRSRPEWRPYNRSKQARVRRRIEKTRS